MCKRERCHCLCLQETHRPTNLSRPKIARMSLVVERRHNNYGTALLIRDDLKDENVYERVRGTVELITIVMSGVVVHSVYKPPNDQFALPALGHRDLPHIVIRYFNNGKVVEQWVDSCDLTLIHDAKLPKFFNSARWKKATTQISSLHLEASRTCVRSQSWSLSRTPNTARSVSVHT